MKIALIGATGFVGSHILKELIARNHQVTAIARHVDALKDVDHVLAVQMDVTAEGRLASALKGNQIVISAYNAGWDNPEIYRDYTEGARHILAAVKQTEAERFIVIGGAGSLLDATGRRLVDAPEFPDAIKPGALAAADFLEVLMRETDLSWTFFSPAVEMNASDPGIRTGTYRTGTDHPVVDHHGRSKLSVEDLAVAIADEIEEPKFINRRFTAAY